MRSTEIEHQLHHAKHELACERCGNRGAVMTKLGIDECSSCQGEGRNKATIALLELLTRSTIERMLP